MLKYKIRTLWKQAKIEAVEILRETEQSVFIAAPHRHQKETREAKLSVYSSYYNTWQDAHAALLADAQRDLASKRDSLARAQAYEGNVRGMKEPQAAAIRTDSTTTGQDV